MEKNVKNILVIGKTGTGKTSFINLLYIISKNYDFFDIKDVMIKTQFYDVNENLQYKNAKHNITN